MNIGDEMTDAGSIHRLEFYCLHEYPLVLCLSNQSMEMTISFRYKIPNWSPINGSTKVNVLLVSMLTATNHGTLF